MPRQPARVLIERLIKYKMLKRIYLDLEWDLAEVEVDSDEDSEESIRETNTVT